MKKEEKIIQLKKAISQLDQEIGYYDALQQGLKLVLNGSYGAYASSYFVLFDNNVAGSVTAEGRELTKTMSDKNEDYWYNQWHLDEELHKKLYIKNVEQISDTKPVSVYGDSVDGDTVIKTDGGDFKIKNLYEKFASDGTNDKEVIPANFYALNWTESEHTHYSKVKSIIRHKVSKKKWRLKAGGKEVIVTSDHSLIVFRNNKK